MKTLFVMMLFFGGHTNVGSTIGGFQSLAACNKAIPKVIDSFGETGLKVVNGFMMSDADLKKDLLKSVSGTCMALEAE